MKGTIMQIAINLSVEECGPKDAAVLRALADAIMNEGAGVADSGRVIHMADKAAERQASASKDAPQEPAKPRKATTRKAAPPKAAPEPQPEPEDQDEDLLGDSAPTLDTAVDRATELVGEGKGPAVKAALKKVGAAKVRELDDEQVVEFLEALEDA